jgi:hypothetical protein
LHLPSISPVSLFITGSKVYIPCYKKPAKLSILKNHRFLKRLFGHLAVNWKAILKYGLNKEDIRGRLDFTCSEQTGFPENGVERRAFLLLKRKGFID